MMSKTHISVGIAAALAVAPATPEGLAYALMGGALGSVICDIDRNSENPSRDNRQGWGIAGTIFFSSFLHETVRDWKTFGAMYLLDRPDRLICIALLLILFLFAIHGSHRGFSHSLLMLAGSAIPIFFLSRKTCLFYIIAFLTHILLDLMNKRPVKVFYPAKGFCMDLCYCDGLMNRILLFAGTAGIIALLFCKFGVNIIYPG